MSDNKKLRAAERVFRSLLKLFPFDFRSNYGRELEQVFREQRREAREGKGLAPIRLWSRTIRGVFSTALSEHLAISAGTPATVCARFFSPRPSR